MDGPIRSYPVDGEIIYMCMPEYRQVTQEVTLIQEVPGKSTFDRAPIIPELPYFYEC